MPQVSGVMRALQDVFAVLGSVTAKHAGSWKLGVVADDRR
jgi:hypothetical protein